MLVLSPAGLNMCTTWHHVAHTLRTCFTNRTAEQPNSRLIFTWLRSLGGLAVVFCHMGDCQDTAALLLGLCLGEVASFCALQTKVGPSKH